jgi:hypothetical protein
MPISKFYWLHIVCVAEIQIWAIKHRDSLIIAAEIQIWAIKHRDSLVIAEMWWKMLYLEITILNPKMGFLERLLPRGRWHDYEAPKTHPWVNPCCLSHASFYVILFGLCVHLRNEKIKNTWALYFTHMMGRHHKADCNQDWQILRFQWQSFSYEILCWSVQSFQIYKGSNFMVWHRNSK